MNEKKKNPERLYLKCRKLSPEASLCTKRKCEENEGLKNYLNFIPWAIFSTPFLGNQNQLQ